jgi:hypothetical protein
VRTIGIRIVTLLLFCAITDLRSAQAGDCSAFPGASDQDYEGLYAPYRGYCHIKNVSPAACNAVHGTWFPDHGAGYSVCHFAPRYSSGTDSPSTAPTGARWGAGAAGIKENILNALLGSGSQASIGTGAGVTRDQVERNALANCQSRGVACKVVGTWANGGCGFMTNGKDNNGRVGWGYGSTAQEAYNNCTNQGVYCDTQTIGFCTTPQ